MSPETATPEPARKLAPSERRNRTLAELAAAQGIIGPQDFDALCGAGTNLWDNDAEFEAFQAALRESRRTGG
jgi:hypothetical protein